MANPNSCGAAPLANELLPSLVGGKSFELPDIDFNDPDFKIPDLDETALDKLKPLTNADLTTRVVGGDGTFDAIMDSINNHLDLFFKKNNITQETKAKVYVESMTAALSVAAQYTLGRDQAYWQAVIAFRESQTAAVGLITAKVALETGKASYFMARAQALNAETEYALNKMRLSLEDANYCLILEQVKQAIYTLEHLLPAQKDNLLEQLEVQRAQTMDTRSDGITPITGQVGKQKELYDQQITSFKRDAEVKAAKLFSDTWNMIKSIDEGLVAPPVLQNDSVNTILSSIKANNNL